MSSEEFFIRHWPLKMVLTCCHETLGTEHSMPWCTIPEEWMALRLCMTEAIKLKKEIYICCCRDGSTVCECTKSYYLNCMKVNYWTVILSLSLGNKIYTMILEQINCFVCDALLLVHSFSRIIKIYIHTMKRYCECRTEQVVTFTQINC